METKNNLLEGNNSLLVLSMFAMVMFGGGAIGLIMNGLLMPWGAVCVVGAAVTFCIIVFGKFNGGK